VYKRRITHLDELKQRLRTEWAKLDHIVIAAAIHQWHRQWVQISNVYFVHTFRVFFHTVYSNGFKSGDFGSDG